MDHKWSTSGQQMEPNLIEVNLVPLNPHGLIVENLVEN